MQFSALSEVLIFLGIILLITRVIVHLFPPKGINHLYGYRTPRSKKSKESWAHAQKLSNRYILNLAVIMLLLGGVSLFIDVSSWSPLLVMIVILLIVLTGFGVLLFLVEKSLRKNFSSQDSKQ